MNHFVPDDDDYVDSLNLARKSEEEDDDLMELLWHDGEVVLQNQRLNNKDKKLASDDGDGDYCVSPKKLHEVAPQHLFIQEDEMTSWLQGDKMLMDKGKAPSASVLSKRKEREAIDEETKQGGGSTSSTKRSRAAQVHNLSERKRRDRINERMKALQELIPRCNKSDKASMLDEAIEYMKSLQLQIQMMSMGCGMMPMMYAGMQNYMPHMAMGMGMNQPLPSFMPFPNMLAAQRPLPTQSRHMGGGSVFSGPHYPVHASDPSRVYVPNHQCDPSSSQPQYPDYVDPYQRFRSLHPTQPPQFQNQATSYPSSSRVSSSKESEDQGNQTTG